MDTYDMIVIGSGPAGQKAAIAAAKLGRRAAIVERGDMVGGVCINTGTIPSKTLREAVLYLTGLNQRELYGQSYRVKDDITVTDLSARTQHVVGREIDVIRNQLARNHVASASSAPRSSSTRTPSWWSTRTATITEIGRREDRRRGRHQAGPAGQRRLRRRDHRRFRPDPGPGQGAVLDGGGRRRGDRHRVRLDVRRARHQGHRGGKAAVDARLLRQGDRRGAAVPAARSGRDLPVLRNRPGGAEASGRHADHPGVRQEDPGRHRAVLRRPAGRHRRTEHRRRRGAGQQPRAGRGQRELPDRGRTHLRRRRRHRLPRAGRHRHGTGPAGHLPRLRRTGRQQTRRPAAHRDLHHPGDQLRRPHRGGADQGERPVRGRVSPVTGSWPAARSSATPTAC